MIKFSIPDPAPNQDIHRSVSPILAAWGPGITYSRLFRFQWIPPDEGFIGTDRLSNRYDPAESVSAYQVLCDLCEEWEYIDDTTLRIALKPDVRWQNILPVIGRELIASDVVFSLRRLQDPSLPNSQLINTVADVREIDDLTIEIETHVPDAELLEKLADARASIVAQEAVAVNGDLLRGPTIGSGPWEMHRFSVEFMTFRSNSDYFHSELPLADGIEISIIPEPDTRVSAFRVGITDLVQTTVEPLVSAVERFPHIRWRTTHNAAAGIEVALNANREPFSDIAVRRAIMKAWDPYSLIDELHNGQSFVSAGLPLQDPSWILNSEDVSGYFNDIDTARLLIQNRELTRGEIFTITVGEYGDQYIKTANRIATAMRSIGIVAEVERVPTRTFGDDVWIGGDYDIYVGAPPLISSVTSTLFSVHHSEGPWSSTGYSDPGLDALIEAQTIRLDRENRKHDILQIQRSIFDGAHRFNAAAKVSHWMWWAHLHNVAPNSYRSDSFWLARLWLTDRIRG